MLLVSFQAFYPEARAYWSGDLIGSFPSGGEEWQWDRGCLGKSRVFRTGSAFLPLSPLLSPHLLEHSEAREERGKKRATNLCACANRLCVCVCVWQSGNGWFCAHESKWLRGVSNEKCVTYGLWWRRVSDCIDSGSFRLVWTAARRWILDFTRLTHNFNSLFSWASTTPGKRLWNIYSRRMFFQLFNFVKKKWINHRHATKLSFFTIPTFWH